MGSCSSVHRTSNSAAKFNMSLFPSKTNRHSVPSAPVEEKPAANGVDALFKSNSLVYKSQVSSMSSVSSFGRRGSKEETFFDSQPYLDSDCDEEFYSVNGDFTPSRGSTPINASIGGTPRSHTLSPQVNRALFEGRPPPYNGPAARSRGSTPIHRSVSASASEGDASNLKGQTLLIPATTESLSPTVKRKKLADLFRESSRIDHQDEQQGNNQVAQKHLQVSSPLKSSEATRYILGPASLANGVERTPIEDSDNKAEKEKKSLRSAQCCFPRLASTRGLKRTTTSPRAIAVDA